MTNHLPVIEGRLCPEEQLSVGYPVDCHSIYCMYMYIHTYTYTGNPPMWFMCIRLLGVVVTLVCSPCSIYYIILESLRFIQRLGMPQPSHRCALLMKVAVMLCDQMMFAATYVNPLNSPFHLLMLH